jgi:hypothetical protein
MATKAHASKPHHKPHAPERHEPEPKPHHAPAPAPKEPAPVDPGPAAAPRIHEPACGC